MIFVPQKTIGWTKDKIYCLYNDINVTWNCISNKAFV